MRNAQAKVRFFLLLVFGGAAVALHASARPLEDVGPPKVEVPLPKEEGIIFRARYSRGKGPRIFHPDGSVAMPEVEILEIEKVLHGSLPVRRIQIYPGGGHGFNDGQLVTVRLLPSSQTRRRLSENRESCLRLFPGGDKIHLQKAD